MNIIEQIKAEIERRIKENEVLPHRHIRLDEDKQLLSFITTLQKEQSSEDLEKEIGKYLVANFTNDEDVETPFLERRFAFWKDDLLRFAKHIAEWQKTKMMEGSFTTIMQTDDLGDRVPTLPDMAQYGYKEGDKVKVIIVNED